MNVLESDTGLKKETGYSQKTNGQYTYHDNSSATDTNNSLGLPKSDLPENKDVKGYMHTHVDNYTYYDTLEQTDVTRYGIKIFSPADMVYFMDMVKNAQDGGRPLGDVYAVMISSNINYQIRFTGNQYQIKTFTQAQNDIFRDLYKDNMKDRIGNQKSLELGFLQFINNLMNLRSISLFRMNANGTNTEISLNTDKTDTIETNCLN